MLTAAALTAYLETVQREYDAGRGASRACYAALKRLLEAVANTRLDESLRRAEAGGPDFVLWREAEPVGWVFVGSAAENHAGRWQALLPAMLTTDYLVFTWRVQNGATHTARVGTLRAGRFERDRDAGEALALLQAYTRWTPPPGPATPAELAARVGDCARALRAGLLECVAGDAPDSELSDHLRALRAALLPGLTPDAFASLYAQVFAYTLLAARLRHHGAARHQPFTRADVQWDLPPTNPLLRNLFRQLGGSALDERAAWLVDALAALLERADADAVLRAFDQRARADDPLAAYYEIFMAHFDPHPADHPADVPVPLAGYMVRSVDYLLRRRFKHALGLADEATQVLDPAAGTGTLLFATLGQVYTTMFQQRQLGGWSDYVSDYLLPRITGFESDPALYALAHLKLGLLLDSTGYDFASSQRLNLFLADALADSAPASGGAGTLGTALASEAQQAQAARRSQPVIVVLSNPHTDPADACTDLLRLAQKRIDQAGSGIVTLVMTSGFLDDPALPAMRRSLIAAFSDIYMLHVRDSAPDERLLNTLAGAVVGIFVRRPGWTPGDQAHVRSADLRGTRAEKLTWLKSNDLTSTSWQDMVPQQPHYTFVPHVTDLPGEYALGWPLAEVFPLHAPGLEARPGAAAISFDRETLRRRAAEAGRALATGDVVPCLYRPFDVRWASTDDSAASVPRALLPHLAARDNQCLLAAPGDSARLLTWAAAGCASADLLADTGALHIFPLYLYPADSGDSSPFPPGPDGRRPNLNPAFILELAGRLGITFIPDGRGDLKTTFGPDDVFDYVYAVISAPAYRARYADFLRAGQPRLPLTGSKKLFRALARKGRALSGLHLLRRADSWPLITGFNGSGAAVVADGYPRFIDLAGDYPRVYINHDKFFDGVPRAVWDFRVGERRVLYDWLAARQGLALDWQDLRHFQQVVVALRDTLALLDELDTLIIAWPLT